MRRKSLTTFLVRGKMARREVIEVSCDLCGRVEAQEAGELPSKVPEVEFSLRSKGHAKHISYSDLCRRCREAVINIAARLDHGEKAPKAKNG